MKAVPALFAAAFALAACVVTTPAPVGPPEFQKGWQDGCVSGYAAAGDPWSNYRQDGQAFASLPEYARGWNAAFTQCRGQYESLRR